MTLSYTTKIDSYIRIINYGAGPRYCDFTYDVRGARPNPSYREHVLCAKFLHGSGSSSRNREGGIERVRAQMRMNCMNGIHYLFPKRIEMREAISFDIFPTLSRVTFPRFYAPVREKRRVRSHRNGVRRKTDNAFGRAIGTQ